MLKTLSNKYILLFSMTMTLIMFTVVIFIVNPLIDKQGGISVLQLQLAFDKQVAINIVNSWGTYGIENFNELIFTDYIYAFSYSLFFASLFSYLLIKSEKHNHKAYKWLIVLAFTAGLLDWIENSLELFFINNQQTFSDTLFFTHSIIASLKWLAFPIVIIYIVTLLLQKDNAIRFKES